MSGKKKQSNKPHAIITGGNKGIGFAIAQKLAETGYALTIIARDKSALDKAKKQLEREYGASVCCAVADLTKPNQITKAFDTARKCHGEVNVLVNNAGAAESKQFIKMDLAEWQTALDVNLSSAFLCSQNVLPSMLKEKNGRIISVASTAGVSGYPYVAAYCAAKHGLIGLTRALALEVASSGVTVNAVCPGFTETELLTRAIQEVSKKTGRTSQEVKAMYLKNNPQNRFVQPSEVASAVAWLCSPDQGAITGQSIIISGGEVLR